MGPEEACRYVESPSWEYYSILPVEKSLPSGPGRNHLVRLHPETFVVGESLGVGAPDVIWQCLSSIARAEL
jgi:hypothetical protein